MCSVLVVEDEIFVAIEIESVIAELGYTPVGIAGDRNTALALAPHAELAFVDLNLRDGLTGPDVGRLLAEQGITVMFMTANPSQLGDGIPGTLGVLPKPASDSELREVVEFAVRRHRLIDSPPPPRVQLFESRISA